MRKEALVLGGKHRAADVVGNGCERDFTLEALASARFAERMAVAVGEFERFRSLAEQRFGHWHEVDADPRGNDERNDANQNSAQPFSPV